MMGKRILVVEDQALVRQSMVMLLQVRMPGLHVEQAGDLAEALRVLDSDGDLDLVTLDLSLPDSQGLHTLIQMKQAHPATPVVVVSAHDDTEQVKAAIDAGAASFVGKSADADALTRAVEHVLRGGAVLPSTSTWLGAAASASAGARPGNDDLVRQAAALLSDRQRDVLRLLVLGKPNKQIGRELDLSEATVKSHLQAAFRHLDVNSRTQAVIAVARLGLRL